jgi:hypothetical protein
VRQRRRTDIVGDGAEPQRDRAAPRREILTDVVGTAGGTPHAVLVRELLDEIDSALEGVLLAPHVSRRASPYTF